jgi:hypothetical protein
MTTVVTRGAASAQALGYASSSAAVNYIEDVFSTYLYTGNGSTQTITNGIDLSTKGGLVWMKGRTTEFGTSNHWLQDTARGVNSAVFSNLTNAQAFPAGTAVSAFNTTGFSLGSNGNVNNLNDTMVSWTFRKQPKFFDIVTYTGNGTARTIAHNLGSVPGCIIVKSTSAVGDWPVYHRGFGNTGGAFLNENYAFGANAAYWNNTDPTSSVFTVGTGGTGTNINGVQYVAYLFAHNAGGFGLTGTDNVISCGSYVGTGVNPGPAINLGYEPQFIIVKNTTSAVDWFMYDTMRGMPVSDVNTGSTKLLRPNTSAAEQGGNTISPTATGFQINTTAAGANTTSETYIYIAIRRGPMKVPVDATKVFTPVLRNGNGSTATVTSAGGVVDLVIPFIRNGAAVPNWFDRLRGRYLQLRSNGSNPENSYSDTLTGFDVMTGFSVGSDAGGFGVNTSGQSIINWSFGRAPGFFDEVCYSGLNSFQDLSHNLGVTPQMIIIKNRTTNGTNWTVGLQGITGTGKYLVLNSTAAVVSDVNYFGSSWTSTNVLVDGNVAPINQSGSNYVMYLFATCPGVSKVGSYTGTGTTLQINCGFTAGSRFVLIKRTDSTGDWYVWDSARGIVAGNDPYLLLNSTAAEDTSTDYVDTYSAGFEISSTAPAAINANGGSFIFFAVS